MSFEIRVGGLTFRGSEYGGLQLSVHGESALTAAEAALLGRLLTAAAPALESYVGGASVVAGRHAGRPAQALSVAESAQTAAVVPARASRTVSAAGVAPIESATVSAAESAAESVAVAVPVRRGPGRPRKVPLSPETLAALAAGAGAKAAPVKAAAAKTTKAKAEKASPAASKVAGAAGQTATAPDRKPREARIVDLFDNWMKANPGPKSRDQLIEVGLEQGWLDRENAKRVFAVVMNRERQLFHMMREGTTDVYVRRSELSQPSSSSPAKLVRRRPDGNVPVSAFGREDDRDEAAGA